MNASTRLYRAGPPRPGVRILTYHEVLESPAAVRNPYNQVSQDALRRQLLALKEAGLVGVAVSELQRRRAQDPAAHGGLIGLTFDDGLETHLTLAAPVLAEASMTATFYIPTASIGSTGSGIGYPARHLTAVQIKELCGAGFEIGSHSRTHPVLSRLGADRIEEEVAGSRRDLQDLLAEDVAAFAYPYGSAPTFHQGVIDAVERAGYASAVSTILGSNRAVTSPFALRRVPVYEIDDADLARGKAFGALDHVGRLQSAWLRLFPHHSTRHSS